MTRTSSSWLLGIAATALLTLLYATPIAQTLGRRRPPTPPPPPNVSSLPVTFAKSPFQVTVSDLKNTVYVAPMLTSSPDVPKKPEFIVKIVGLSTGDWHRVETTTDWEYARKDLPGRLRLDWDAEARVLIIRLRHTLDVKSGGKRGGPSLETIAFDVSMIDRDTKNWYFTRFVQSILATDS